MTTDNMTLTYKIAAKVSITKPPIKYQLIEEKKAKNQLLREIIIRLFNNLRRLKFSGMWNTGLGFLDRKSSYRRTYKATKEKKRAYQFMLSDLNFILCSKC